MLALHAVQILLNQVWSLVSQQNVDHRLVADGIRHGGAVLPGGSARRVCSNGVKDLHGPLEVPPSDAVRVEQARPVHARHRDLAVINESTEDILHR